MVWVGGFFGLGWVFLSLEIPGRFPDPRQQPSSACRVAMGEPAGPGWAVWWRSSSLGQLAGCWGISCQVLSSPWQPGLHHCSLLISKINSTV